MANSPSRSTVQRPISVYDWMNTCTRPDGTYRVVPAGGAGLGFSALTQVTSSSKRFFQLPVIDWTSSVKLAVPVQRAGGPGGGGRSVSGRIVLPLHAVPHAGGGITNRQG